tara:strand:- start:2990 stop:3364 length:375 start_codon:yes stop_codon:yes gene_type:complete
LIVLDSSLWISFFNDDKNASLVEECLTGKKQVLVPAICIYEIYKIMNRKVSYKIATNAVAFMESFGAIIDIDYQISLIASKTNAEHKLPMADSLIYATGVLNNAEIWTQDSDFENLDNVKFFSS